MVEQRTRAMENNHMETTRLTSVFWNPKYIYRKLYTLDELAWNLSFIEDMVCLSRVGSFSVSKKIQTSSWFCRNKKKGICIFHFGSEGLWAYVMFFIILGVAHLGTLIGSTYMKEALKSAGIVCKILVKFYPIFM